MDRDLRALAVRVWLMEILVAGFNYFVLMNLVWEPAFGELAAHQIGMATRIACIFAFAYGLVRHAREPSARDLALVGVLWLGMALVFEWGGSLLTGRSVHEILVGWHVEDGRMWPFVLLAYLTANLIVGAVLRRRGGLRPGRAPSAAARP